MYTLEKLCHSHFMDQMFGQLLALGTAFCWAQNSLIYAHVGKQVTSSAVAHIRLWIALPMVMAVHVLMVGTGFPIGVNPRALFLIGLSGLAGFFLADLFIFASLALLGARRTMVIMTSSPIFAAVISRIFYQELLSAVQISGIALTLAGVGWVVLADNPRSSSPSDIQNQSARKTYRKGTVLAFGGALTQAAAMVLAKAGMAIDALHPVSANTIRIAAGLAGLILFAAAGGKFRADFRRFQGPAGHRALGLVALAAAVGPVLGIILNLQALSLAPVGVVTTLAQITPIILLPIEFFIMKQPVSRGAVLGTVTALAGTALLFL